MNNKNIIIILILCLSLNGCEEFFEKDLTLEKVVLLSPPDSLITGQYTHTLKWENLEDAQRYNLIIVAPGFEKIEKFILDSILSETSFNIQLDPGNYQWGVKAINNSSSSLYSVRTLFVDTNKVFSDNTITLKLPEINFINTETVLFKWEIINDADKYRFEVRYGNWNTGFLYLARDIIYDTITLHLEESNYYWGVQAIDNETNSQTKFATKQLFVDITKPNKPVLLNPADNETITESSFKLEWTRGLNNGSPITDSIIVSNNLQFTDIKLKAATSDTSYTIQPGIGHFFWRVKSMDKAGNFSDYSDTRKIVFTN